MVNAFLYPIKKIGKIMKQKLNTRLIQNREKYKAMEQFWEPGWRPVSKPRLIQENSLEKQQKRQNKSAGQPED